MDYSLCKSVIHWRATFLTALAANVGQTNLFQDITYILYLMIWHTPSMFTSRCHTYLGPLSRDITYIQHQYLRIVHISSICISGYPIYPVSLSQDITYIQYLYLRISHICSICISICNICLTSVYQISYIYPVSLSQDIIYIQRRYISNVFI